MIVYHHNNGILMAVPTCDTDTQSGNGHLSQVTNYKSSKVHSKTII